MNATEQKNHKTALNTLENATATALEAVDIQLRGLHVEMQSTERRCMAAIGELANAQRCYTDAADDKIDRAHDALVADFVALRHRGFWSRANWLLTGR